MQILIFRGKVPGSLKKIHMCSQPPNMITNLFSVFDGIGYYHEWGYGSLQIASLAYYGLSSYVWKINNSYNRLKKIIKALFLREFSRLLISHNLKYVLIINFTLLIYLASNNLFSLFPHILGLFCLFKYSFFCLLFWLAFIFFCSTTYINNFFSHIIPHNTPFMLIHFIVLIELVRNTIRPLTLAIRLIANITAGHLILTLIGVRAPALNLSAVLFIILIIIIMVIELAVSVIQGYIYSVLLVLYYNDISK